MKTQELWKEIKDYPDYEISSLGRIWSKKTKIFMKSHNASSSDLHQKVKLSHNGESKKFFVHRLIMLAFSPKENPDLFQVNHIDGDKSNNSIENLEWVTPQENTDHAFDTGLRPRKDRPETLLKKKEAMIRRYQRPEELEKLSENSKKMWKIRKEKGWKSWKTWN